MGTNKETTKQLKKIFTKVHIEKAKTLLIVSTIVYIVGFIVGIHTERNDSQAMQQEYANGVASVETK